MASYRKTSTGWKATVSKRINGKLSQTSKRGFRTKNEAIMWAAAIEADIDGVEQAKNNPSFADYFLDYFKTYKEPQLSQVSISRYLRIHKELTDYFGNQKLKSIRRSDYQKFINHYGSSHSKETVYKLHSLVKASVSLAFNDRLVPQNFCENISIVYKDAGKQISYLNVSEIKQLVKTASEKLNPNFPGRYMILTAIFTGARLGEIMALTWEDIDFTNHTININKALEYNYGRDFKATKTESSNRTIRVNQILLDWLKDLQGHNMVFQSRYGTVPSSSAVNKLLKQLLIDAGITRPGFHFHSLRHSHVAYLMYQGLELYVISKRLGHSNVSTTANIYAYLIDEHKNKADDLIEQRLDNLLDNF